MTDTTELRRRLREALDNREQTYDDPAPDDAIVRRCARELLTALDAADAQRDALYNEARRDQERLAREMDFGTRMRRAEAKAMFPDLPD